MIEKPGLYKFVQNNKNGKVNLGSFGIQVPTVPPISVERKTAIKSDPTATKAVRMRIECNQCFDGIGAYTALDRSDEQEKEEWIWYENLPEVFTCKCKKTKTNLQYIRANLHALLGTKGQDNQEINVLPLYERSLLESIKDDFAKLLDSNPREEDLQKFIEKNPVLLHQFPAERIIPKPKILTHFVGDFAIVTTQRELILIELEKTSTRLMKKNGHRAADLTHAFDQVRDWFKVIEDHRQAVLSELNIDHNQISNIKGVVIAGRENQYNSNSMRRLKMSDGGCISLLTFDDLLFSMSALVDEFHKF